MNIFFLKNLLFEICIILSIFLKLNRLVLIEHLDHCWRYDIFSLKIELIFFSLQNYILPIVYHQRLLRVYSH